MTTPSISVPTLGDRYVTEKEIGRHGIVIVYAGVDRRLRRRVTVTVLAPRSATEKALASAHYRAAVKMLGLDHPNIIAFYEAVRRGDEYYFATEFVEGQALAERLAAGESLPEGVVRSYAAQVAGAIAYAQAKGVPLDVRLKAIYTTADGIVKIATAFAAGLQEHDPGERFSSADELYDALHATRTGPQLSVTGADVATFMMDAVANHFSNLAELPAWDVAEPRRWPKLAIIGTACLLLLVGAISYAATQVAAVGDLRGMDQTEAQDTLLDDGLSVSFAPRTSTQVLPAHVIEQQPPPGKWLRKGSEVLLTVSVGPPAASAPHSAPRRVAKSSPHDVHTAAPAKVASNAKVSTARAAPAASPAAAKRSCPSGNAVDIQGYPPGCLAPSISSSGKLLGGMIGSTVPVTSVASPGKVLYAMAYVSKPPGPKRFVGVISGNGNGNLIVRVQDGMFVAQNGSHASYETFNGERLAGTQGAPPETNAIQETAAKHQNAGSKCPQTPWLRRKLHDVFNVRSRPCT